MKSLISLFIFLLTINAYALNPVARCDLTNFSDDGTIINQAKGVGLRNYIQQSGKVVGEAYHQNIQGKAVVTWIIPWTNRQIVQVQICMSQDCSTSEQAIVYGGEGVTQLKGSLTEQATKISLVVECKID